MDWAEARPRLDSPILAPLAPAIARLPADRWPTLDDLNALAAGLTTGRGHALRFVRARAPGDREPRPCYELHIAETGEVETRPGSWHDLFNALAWVTYPRAKARINSQHVALLQERGEAEVLRRGPERDALTLFDEGGLAVATTSRELAGLIEGFHWKEAFWSRREELLAAMRFFAFGHALHEKALAPYVGMVAKVVFVDVDEDFLRLPPAAQVRQVDAALDAHFSDRARFRSPRLQPPLPVLGIPGWDERTADPAFYDDTAHFRPRRR